MILFSLCTTDNNLDKRITALLNLFLSPFFTLLLSSMDLPTQDIVVF